LPPRVPGAERHGASGADVRFHHRAGPCLGRRRKRGQSRQAARSRGICPAIPYRTTTKDKSKFFPKALYRGRARIEQTMGKLKRFKRVALRCEKTDENYGSFVALALSFILIKSVHMT
jgi:transposase